MKPRIRTPPNSYIFNPQIQSLMQQKLQNVQTKIDNRGLPFLVDAVIQNGQINYQRWKFSFKGKEYITMLVSKPVLEDGKLEKQMVEQNFPSAFKDKCVSGILDFPNDYPNSAPKFTFDSINGETLQHINIYGGGLFCVPLFSTWNASVNVSELQILSILEYYFHNPNINDPANPPFSSLSEDEKYQIQLKQAQYLEDY